MLRRLVVSVWIVVAIVLGLGGPGYAVDSNVSLGMGSSGLSRNSTLRPHVVAAEPVTFLEEKYVPMSAPPDDSVFYWGALMIVLMVVEPPPAGVGWRAEAYLIDASDPRSEAEQLASSPMKLLSEDQDADLGVATGILSSQLLDPSHSLEPGHQYYVLYRMRHLNSSVWISSWRSQSHPGVFASSSALPTVPAEQSGPCSCPDAQGYALDPVNTATRRYTTLGGPGLPSAWGNTYSGDKYVGGGRHHTETYVPQVESTGDKIAMAVILGGAYSVPVAGQILTAIDIAEMSQDGFTQEECIEIGIGAVPGGKAVRGVSRSANGAGNAANGMRLGQQLARESAESAFTSSGRLSSGALAESRQIIPGSKLGNKDLIQRLTSDGSDIADWGKYTTRTHQSPSGDFQVHFYMNRGTGAVDYGYDYKIVFKGGR